jgi:hypothetical protein
MRNGPAWAHRVPQGQGDEVVVTSRSHIPEVVMPFRSLLYRSVAAAMLLFTLFFAAAPPVSAQGETDKVAECITDSWDEYLECLEDLPWWAELLCAARFTADVVLCLPKIVLDGAK